MKFKYGKVQFGKRDTYVMNSILSGLICDGITKLRNQLLICDTNGNAFGVPLIENNTKPMPVEMWFEILNKIIYAFDDNKEPDLSDYIDFSVLPDNYDIGSLPEYKKFIAALDDWQAKREEGRSLFAEHFDYLQY